MVHVRGRRLVRAAQRLTADPDLRLVDLALDCGFDSQEAFTRAFARLFGVAPGRFRRGFCVTPIEGQYPMTMSQDDGGAAAVSQLPDLVPLDGFTVAGPAARFDEANRAEIPQLWSRLIGALPFAGQARDLLTNFGATVSNDRMTVDGNIYTSGGVTSGIDMALRVVGDLAGEVVARKIQLAMEYDPAPPFTGGTPYTSPPEIVAAVLADSTKRRAKRETQVAQAAETMRRTN